VGADPDDLWDFGTIRHVARPGTLGRATARTENGLTYPQPVSGLDTNYMPHQNSNGVRPPSVSASSISSSSTVTVKGDLPALPVRNPTYEDQSADQGTVRTTPKRERNREGSYDSNRSVGSDDSDRELRAEAARQQLANVHLEDEVDADLEEDLDERTMLDSVVLPAIASVRPRSNVSGCFRLHESVLLTVSSPRIYR
jgi:serine/threonine-protein kinase 24/25/MST4